MLYEGGSLLLLLLLFEAINTFCLLYTFICRRWEGELLLYPTLSNHLLLGYCIWQLSPMYP